MNDLIIENISNANDEFLQAFYKEINELDNKLVNIINSKDLKIILANKLYDVLPQDNNDIEKTQDYHPVDRNLTTRGLCSDTINSICIFSNTVTTQNVGAILYHEIGHLIDLYYVWQEPEDEEQIKIGQLSSKEEFKNAYKKEVAKKWDRIKNDNRFRLKHYIQSSTPNNISDFALMETFAHCFARINGKFDDIDILGEYFVELLPVSQKLYSEFLDNCNVLL